MSVKLTDDIKLEILRLQNDGYSSRQIAEVVGCGKSSVNDFLAGTYHQEFWENYTKPVAQGTKNDHWNNLKRKGGNCFIVTSAQNNTYVHSEFLKALEQAADYYGAEIIVSTYTYNKSGFQNLEKDSDSVWYDPKIRNYICNEPVLFADDLVLCGELNILPTAVNPLSGLHSYTRAYSGIVPHAKVQMESLATHKSKPARSLFTTGTVTQRNYIEQKSGQKAIFHHIFGALLVEVDSDGDWFVRQLIAETDTGEFYDLNVKFKPEGVEEGCPVEALTYGDIHAERLDELSCEASFGKGDSMLDVLQPEYQFVHDVLDFTTRNHHNRNDPYFRWKTYNDKVDNDIVAVASVLNDMKRDNTKTVVVESNHNLAMERWLKEADYKNDSPENALTFLKCQTKMVQSIMAGEYVNIFEWYLKENHPYLADAIFLKLDESFMICGDDGIEQGSHGHLGTNGSRGGIGIYQKLGSRHTIGHSHSPAIKDGVYVVGVLGSLDLGYNSGGSSWQHCNCVTYKNGKRALLFIKNGKWKV
jgi:hypothetical protein